MSFKNLFGNRLPFGLQTTVLCIHGIPRGGRVQLVDRAGPGVWNLCVLEFAQIAAIYILPLHAVATAPHIPSISRHSACHILSQAFFMGIHLNLLRDIFLIFSILLQKSPISYRSSGIDRKKHDHIHIKKRLQGSRLESRRSFCLKWVLRCAASTSNVPVLRRGAWLHIPRHAPVSRP